ncbi:carotenoid oxygenase family protein, partial [Leptolyngbya sp. FACHB-711]|uniref:carotenoid oxygenase family protein n=1 Tax=Leptolyngbya sp. FACHB-711 TaxID=2692813 RepID=UPI0018F01E0B
AIGFETATEEATIDALPLTGTLPEWLTGTLIRTGPAQFDIDGEPYRHWFDGLAMLSRFSFQAGRVSYVNRFLASDSYQEAHEKGKISRGEFGTTARTSFWKRLRDPLPRPTDNANVNILPLGDRLVSTTEVPQPIVFNPDTLETLDKFPFDDRILGQTTTVHPHFDFDRQCLFNYLIAFGSPSKYNIYRMGFHNSRRELVASIPVKEPAYMHTFAMSDRYIILTEFPLRLNLLGLLTSGKPFIENYRWKTDRGTHFTVVDKSTGEVVKTCESEPFFAFHHVNAFEQDDELLIDLIAYPDGRIIDDLYLEPLRTGRSGNAAGKLKRYRLNLNSGDAIGETLSDETIELPRIHYRQANAKPYQFVYGVGNQILNNFNDQLVKINVNTGETAFWSDENCYPGEPVFVSAPNASAEDEGILLSVVLDADRKQSFLLMLDAQSMSELARAEVPHVIPFQFHGQYFPSIHPAIDLSQIHR